MFEKFLFRIVVPKRNLFVFSSITIFLTLAFGFLLLSILVSNNQTAAADLAISKQFQSFSSPILTSVMILVSFFGDGAASLLAFAVFSTLLIMLNYKREALFALAIWIGPLLSLFLKNTFSRPRPELDVNFGYSVPTDFGFPSGHVVFYVLFFGLMAFYAIALTKLNRWWQFLFLSTSLPLIIFVGTSRVYLGVHWPTDVLAGYLLGFAVLEILIIGYLKLIVYKK